MTETTAEPCEPPRPLESPTFADFDVHPDIVAALAERRHRHPVPDPGDDPAGRPRRPRHHRPGQDRHRQDPRLRRPAAQPHRRPRRRRVRRAGRARQAAGPRRRPDPRARRPGRRRPRARPASAAASASSPSTAAAPTSRRSRRCSTGVEVVVGTPGRLIDLAKQGHLDLSQARTVVLDEADEMLDLGFLPDVEKLLALTPAARQTMLFSATMPGADRGAGPPLHEPADAHPRDGRRRARTPTRSRPSSSSSTAPTRWTRSRCSPACCRPRAAA